MLSAIVIEHMHRAVNIPYTTVMACACSYKVQHDHPMVAAMRATGALLLGKTNMHELGVSPLGLNMHHGIPRNPHNPSCFAGGSSSGSATVVAAGLCPFAIGSSLTCMGILPICIVVYALHMA